MRSQQLSIEMAQHLELIVPTDADQHRGDLGIGESSVQVLRSLLRGRSQHAGGRELHRFQRELRPQPAQTQLERDRKDRR
jgi:hypothetical protein